MVVSFTPESTACLIDGKTLEQIVNRRISG